jgi:DNA-binding IclR family transcriptional regulator
MMFEKEAPKESAKLIEAVDKALCLLQCFSDTRAELSLKELSEETGLNKSRILRLTGTLASHGFLVRRSGSLYSLGPEVLVLGKIYERSNSLISLARPLMKTLVMLTGESVKLFVIKDRKRVCLARELSPSRLHYAIKEGEALPLAAGAGGKVLLAYAPAEFRDAVLEEGLEEVTPTTIVKRDRLLEELRTVSRQGYAVSVGELVSEVGGVAAPVFDNEQKVVAAMVVAGPIQRFNNGLYREKLNDLLDICRQLSFMLGYKGSHPYTKVEVQS